MIESLEYSVTFSNGRNIARSLNPSPNGTTLIVGKNEAGKSLNLEMLAYALFGTEALRGAASEYSRIKVEAKVVIKHITYTITRTKSDATISDATGILAKGTSPVNQRIQMILGFGLSVFKVSNWCAQGDIQALANMLPTQRRQMIDEVSGLTQLDGVMDWAKSMAKAAKTSAAAIIENLYQPTKPELAEGTLTKAELEKANEDLEARLETRRKMELALAVAPSQPLSPAEAWVMAQPTKPSPVELPIAPEAPEDFDYSQYKSAEYGEWNETSFNNCIPFLTAMPAWLKRKDTLTQMLDMKRSQAKAGGPVEYNEAQLNEFEKAHELNFKVGQKQQLQSKGTVECPNCKHSHYIATELLEQYADVPDEPVSVPLTVAQIKALYKRFELLEEVATLEKELNEFLTERPMPMEDYQVAEHYAAAMVAHKQMVAAYQDNLKNFQDMVSRINSNYDDAITKWKQEVINVDEANKREAQAYKDRQDWYTKAVAQYDLEMQEFSKIKAEYEKLDSSETLKLVKQQLDKHSKAHIEYEALMVKYGEELARYNQSLLKYNELEAKQESYELAGRALKEVKSRVKGYLVPSLSRVASQLLNEMTGGERAVVEISEDFEIMVDGQSLRTLSGSGKDITNLAIRIALGQVLTHKVMPLMMFDEIDAAMDQTRSEYTWQCIQKITPRIGQVLLVSHKDLTSTYRISV